MHLSSDAKYLLYKCVIITAMMRRLTNLVWSYFPQINVSGKQIQKRCEARDVSNAKTEFARAISIISLVRVQPNTACVTKFTL